MTTEILIQRIRDIANDLNEDPDIDHRHTQAILFGISALVGFGRIQQLSPSVHEILIREYESIKEQIESN